MEKLSKHNNAIYSLQSLFTNTHDTVCTSTAVFLSRYLPWSKIALSPNTSQKLALQFDLTILGLRSGKHLHLKVVLVVLFVTV